MTTPEGQSNLSKAEVLQPTETAEKVLQQIQFLENLYPSLYTYFDADPKVRAATHFSVDKTKLFEDLGISSQEDSSIKAHVGSNTVNKTVQHLSGHTYTTFTRIADDNFGYRPYFNAFISDYGSRVFEIHFSDYPGDMGVTCTFDKEGAPISFAGNFFKP